MAVDLRRAGTGRRGEFERQRVVERPRTLVDPAARTQLARLAAELHSRYGPGVGAG